MDKIEQKRKLVGGTRSITRLYAVQILYCSDTTNRLPSHMLLSAITAPKVFLDEEHTLTKIDRSFLKKLITIYESNSTQISETITQYLPDDWKIDRLDPVMYAILRLAITEILYFSEIAHTIVLNEYIELAKAFFDKPEASFVNGILSSISTATTKAAQNRTCSDGTKQ